MKKFALLVTGLLVGMGFSEARNLYTPDFGLKVSEERAMSYNTTLSVGSPERSTDGKTLSREAYTTGSLSKTTSTPEYAAYRAPGVSRVVDLSGITGTKSLWYTLSSDHTVGLASPEVTALESNSYKVAKFIYSDVDITLSIDPATGKVTLPCQKVTDIGENELSICKFDPSSSTFSVTDPIAGEVVDGAIHISDSFGFFVTKGPNFGQYLNIGIIQHAVIGKSNATFTNNAIVFKDNTMTQANRTIVNTTTESYTYRVGSDRLRVLYIPLAASKYGELTATLNPGGTVSIDPQPAMVYSIYGDFYYYGLTEEVATDGTISFKASMLSPIEAAYNATAKTVSIPCWGIARTTGGLLATNESSVLTLSSALTFPQGITLNLSGSGTEADPYLIKTAEDFLGLGNEIRTNSAVRGPAEQIPNSTDNCYPAYKGKYFKLANDIDFSGLQTTYRPVADKVYPFAGILDGDGHTISNFTIQNYAYDYCGLFGVISKDGVIKNIKFDKCNVSTIGYTAGIVCGYAHGELTGIEITSSKVTASAGYNVGGLSGYTRNVSNCKLSDITVTALGYVGGMVGRSFGNVTDCEVIGNVYMTGAQMFGGGVIGFETKETTAQPNNVVSGCSFSGIVSASNNQIAIGGIAGAFSYSTMEKCYSNGIIANGSEQSSYMGGLVGTSFDMSIKNCFATGFVRNLVSKTAGGLIGHVTTSATSETPACVISNSYSSAMLHTASTDPARGIAGDSNNLKFENTYYDAQIAAVENETYGLLTSDLTSGKAPAGYNADIWTVEEGFYPRLKGTESSKVADVAVSALILPGKETVKVVENNFAYSSAPGVAWTAVVDGKYNATGGYAFTFDKGVGRLNYEQYTDTIFVQKENAYKYYFVNFAPVLFDGEGTAENPWKVSTKADLLKFSSMSANSAVTFENKYFEQTADIDLEGETFIPICKDTSSKLKFEGCYDGKGHTIQGMKIASVVFYTEEDVPSNAVVGQVNAKSANTYTNSGMFANVGPKGVVKNVVIGDKCEYDLFSMGGAIVGVCEGTVENCSNYAEIRGYTFYLGGMVGNLKKGGKVTGCYNAGKIRVNAYTGGGMVGQTDGGIIENCENTGTVECFQFNPNQSATVQKQVGGIAGLAKNATITNVSNSGMISSYKEVGGIVGNIATTTVTNALNYGYVTATNELVSLGSIAGANSGATFVNCVTDNRIQKTGAVANGMLTGTTGMSTAQIAGNKSLFGEGWTVDDNCYPHIAFAKVPAQVALNSKAVIGWSGSDYSQAMSSDATLAKDLTWTLENNNGFAVSGNTLKVNVPAEGMVENTLTATLNGVSRNFYLKTFNGKVFEGEGTEASPFVIATADDFLKLANMVNDYQYGYDGYVFKQTADLDFTGKTFVPVANNTTLFNATYDGNGKKIKAVNYDNPTTDKTKVLGGLFGVVGSAGVIKGITLDNTSKISTQTYAGGIAAYLYGTISNCENNAEVTVYGTLVGGGIAAYALAGAKINDCINNGIITVKTNYAGGIVGQTPANASVTITNCINDGSVKSAVKAGGIVGSGSATISGSANTGVVEATTNYAAGIIGEALFPSSIVKCENDGEVKSPQYIGGILATSANHTADLYLKVEDCHNLSDISAGTKGYVGGIAGSVNSYIEFVKCSNKGVISGSTTTTGGMRLAGIVSSTNDYANLTGCYNTGKIIGYSNSAGIIGATSKANNNIVECYNTADITGDFATATNLGGIIGNGTGTISRCYNTGNITGKGKQVGGIIGNNTSTSLPVTDCYNSGNITASECAGGFGGFSRGHIDGFVNFGTITANNNIGGILGQPAAAQAASYLVTISNAVNLGKVESTGANKAVIVAKNTNCKYLEVKNVYFDNTINTETSVDKEFGENIKGLSTAELVKTNISDAYTNGVAVYPMLKSMTGIADYAFNSAIVLFSGEETAEKVCNPFEIGTPEGVAWTTSSNLEVSGNTVKFNTSSKDGEKATLTKTAGELTKTYDIVIYPSLSDISDIVSGDSDIISVTYYTIDGKELAEPVAGQLMIRKTVYADGKVVTDKVAVARR